MNKKTLERLTNNSNYNQELFTLAKEIVQNCSQLITKTQELSHPEKSAIKDKQQQLENAIKTAINSLGKFVNVPKPPLATPADYGLSIFQSITDSIETSVQRCKQSQKNNKKQQQKAKATPQNKRPQDIWPFIKPASYDYHNHEKNLEFIRTQLHVTKSRSLDDPFCYVSTPTELENMIEELLKQSQIAVDVQHSSKSYRGFTCLLQISSRQKDYIIDVFPIWREIPLLKKVMQNDSIIKVMHGAEMDTQWLQRDFNIHIYNLFDTYKGSRVLGLAKLSYAYLLNYYCNMTTDKTYQLADWRQRPLSTQMIHYARIDTHYLLEIFDRLLADIHQKALTMRVDPFKVISDVYASSYETTKIEAELFNFTSKQFYQKLKKTYKEKQFKIYHSIFEIVDRIAQKQDVSFDQLLHGRLDDKIVSRIREILLKGRDNLKIRIDSFLNVFKQSPQQQIFQKYLVQIKESLEKLLANHEESKDVVQKKKQKNKIAHLEQQHPTEETSSIKHKYIRQFKEFPQKTYQCMNINPFSMLIFQPIMGFLSKKAGVIEKEEQEVMDAEESNIQQKQSQIQDDLKANEEQKQAQQDGIIEFKRINPNVLYTLQQAEPVEQVHKPRKKRKEMEYEKKLKNKEGNIFQLLDD